MEFLQQWASLILALIAIGTALWNWLNSGSKDAHRRIDRMEEDRSKTADAIVTRFQLFENRLVKLETDYQHLPDNAQLQKLEIGFERLNGQVQVLSERLQPVTAVAMRLQEMEFERANGK